MTFAEKLQELRKTRQLSQEELAASLEVSRQSVSKWENALAYPDTEKLIKLSEFFRVPLDSLIREMPEPTAEKPQQKQKSKSPLIITLLCALLIPTGIFSLQYFMLKSQPPQTEILTVTAAELQTVTVTEKLTYTVTETVSVPVTVTVTETVSTPALTDFAYANSYFYRLAQQHRFDYMPCFETGKAPTESPDYLFFAFAINLDNWGADKGKMSAAYVEDTVLSYFGVSSLSHLPLRKSWNYSEGVYTALPQGLRDLPVYAMRSMSVRLQDGITLYEIILDNYTLANGNIPSLEDMKDFEQALPIIDTDKWQLNQSESFTLTLNNGKPFIRSHTLL